MCVCVCVCVCACVRVCVCVRVCRSKTKFHPPQTSGQTETEDTQILISLREIIILSRLQGLFDIHFYNGSKLRNVALKVQLSFY